MAKLRSFLPLPLVVAAALLIAMAATHGIVNSQSGNGKYDADGDGLIEIDYLEQLDAIRYDLDGNGGADTESRADAYTAAFPVSAGESVCNNDCNGYELARSLDFDDPASYSSGAVNAKWTSGDGWLPIGNYPNSFEASFNGNRHTITSLYINRTTQFNNPGVVGLFGRANGEISDVGLIDTDVTGVESVGGLAGWAENISGCYATGSVSGEFEVGGLVGSASSISDSYAASIVSGSGGATGGLAGGSGTVHNSYSSSSVFGNGPVGGLVGVSGRIERSYATGNVSGDEVVGGLAGDADDVYASYATGNVSGSSEVGGLVGVVGSIRNSFASGSVSGSSSVGGLVGVSNGTISGNYATGNVSGESSVGGLVGSRRGTIVISYSTGRVTGQGGNVGGLVGLSRDGDTVIGGYWDIQTSAQRTSAAGEGKTTAELQSPTGYTGVYAAWRIDLDNADQDFDQSTGVDDVWDFGTSSQYPAVKADFNGDSVATWQEFGNQRPQSPAPTARPTAASTPTSTTGAVDSNARPSAEVFGELVNAGLLASVWRYHNATASWDAYDPNIPDELNDLTHAAPKDIVWVKVTETTQFQGRTLHKGWNLITLK